MAERNEDEQKESDKASIRSNMTQNKEYLSICQTCKKECYTLDDLFNHPCVGPALEEPVLEFGMVEEYDQRKTSEDDDVNSDDIQTQEPPPPAVNGTVEEDDQSNRRKKSEKGKNQEITQKKKTEKLGKNQEQNISSSSANYTGVRQGLRSGRWGARNWVSKEHKNEETLNQIQELAPPAEDDQSNRRKTSEEEDDVNQEITQKKKKIVEEINKNNGGSLKIQEQEITTQPKKNQEQNINRRYIQSKNYKGVKQNPSGKWEANIWDPEERKMRRVGTFKTEEEAARAYDKVAIGFRGSSAKLNFPSVEHKHRPTSLKIQEPAVVHQISNKTNSDDDDDEETQNKKKRKQSSDQDHLLDQNGNFT